jgi:hypothetical protein
VSIKKSILFELKELHTECPGFSALFLFEGTPILLFATLTTGEEANETKIITTVKEGWPPRRRSGETRALRLSLGPCLSPNQSTPGKAHYWGWRRSSSAEKSLSDGVFAAAAKVLTGS